MICDLLNKIRTAIFFNLTHYFMIVSSQPSCVLYCLLTHTQNLRRTLKAFFTFFLFSFTTTIAMSIIFRSISSLSCSLAQALAPAAVFILALIIYTSFTILTRDMHPWFWQINYLNLVAYAFEALMINKVCTPRYKNSLITYYFLVL